MSAPSEVFIFSSDVKNGAINKSVDGSRFTVQFTNPVFLPENAYNAKLEVLQATIWNNSPNISSAKGNNTFTISDNSGNHTVAVSDGLYDIDTLYTELAQRFDNLPVSRPLFPFGDYFAPFSGNESTNKLYITFKNTGSAGNPQILWANSTLRDVMGFASTSPTRPPQSYTANHEYSLTSPLFPKFNAYNSFIIHSDLVNDGIQLNNSFDRIISKIPITTSVGTIENYIGTESTIFAMCNNLIGRQSAKWSAEFYLTSETGEPLDTLGENWDIVIKISWLERQNE